MLVSSESGNQKFMTEREAWEPFIGLLYLEIPDSGSILREIEIVVSGVQESRNRISKFKA